MLSLLLPQSPHPSLYWWSLDLLAVDWIRLRVTSLMWNFNHRPLTFSCNVCHLCIYHMSHCCVALENFCGTGRILWIGSSRLLFAGGHSNGVGLYASTYYRCCLLSSCQPLSELLPPPPLLLLLLILFHYNGGCCSPSCCFKSEHLFADELPPFRWAHQGWMLNAEQIRKENALNAPPFQCITDQADVSKSKQCPWEWTPWN